jgi:hypothetical protein
MSKEDINALAKKIWDEYNTLYPESNENPASKMLDVIAQVSAHIAAIAVDIARRESSNQP